MHESWWWMFPMPNMNKDRTDISVYHSLSLSLTITPEYRKEREMIMVLSIQLLLHRNFRWVSERKPTWLFLCIPLLSFTIYPLHHHHLLLGCFPTQHSLTSIFLFFSYNNTTFWSLKVILGLQLAYSISQPLILLFKIKTSSCMHV